jgi:hypothetical protein
MINEIFSFVVVMTIFLAIYRVAMRAIRAEYPITPVEALDKELDRLHIELDMYEGPEGELMDEIKKINNELIELARRTEV